jgi:hypothetical protein
VGFARRATRWVVLGFGTLLACAGCSVEPQVETVPLVLRELDGCALGHPSSIEVRALGDFPAITRNLPADLPVSTFDGLPRETRELLVRSRVGNRAAIGRRLVTAPVSALPLLVLPSGRSCPLGDPAARAPVGAAVAPLPSGGFLVAGGVGDDDVVESDAVTFAPGAALVELVPNGMLLPRAYASATPVGPLVVVAGGAGDPGTYEVFDSETGSFAGSRSRKLATGPRMEHAALLLSDDRVLLVGGRAQPGGPPLATAELLELSSGTHEVVSGEAGLGAARVLPSLLRLDSGSVIVLGGRSEKGELITSLERFDAQARRFTPIEPALPPHDEVVAAALPGARVAWLGCDAGIASPCALTLLFENDGDFVREDVALEATSEAPLGLSDLRMVALDSGRLLLTGSVVSDPSASRRAFLIDVDRSTIDRLSDVSRVPSALLVLRTGQVAELDAAGASLREQDSLSEYESSDSDLITPTLELIALDVSTHWQRTPEGLQAVVAARMDVPKLRFAALRVELDCIGDARLLFVGDAGDTLTAELAAGEVRLGSCRQRLPDGAHLVAIRDQTRLVLRASSGAALCEAVLVGPVHLALQASADTLIRAFRAERR